ncbi:Hypothetical protein NCS54_01069700 [Fusarium falciforme]|uniref:Hypothetical protein n=1 Tax=Fusarium falciforme TaxID=195108 RepID=UPI0022FFFA82|nr:Hypothetical protein NCS54_01069700 [Fusarium falciforme]WAO93162.1 Hypothetical protein NCS54_01069700 [Fusarium falciforme]
MELPVRTAQADDAMELYATGFNAWNQVTFEPSAVKDEPDDIFSFTKILGTQKLDRVVSQMCYTAVQREGTWSLAGLSPGTLVSGKADQRYLFDHPSAISADGRVLTVEGLGRPSQAIVEYPALAAWRTNRSTRSWPSESGVRQIAAYNGGFVILHEDTSVSTMGDPRFGDCLGREVDESSPADVPSLVSDLREIGEPIKKVSAGGYTLAALTEGGGLYLWGMQSPGSQSRHQAFSDLSGIPNYVEVDGEKDVQDIALGESHAIALTTDGCVYVVGDNTNGQLGLGSDSKGPVESWLKVPFNPPSGWEVVGVEAGPRSSFIVTAKAKPK